MNIHRIRTDATRGSALLVVLWCLVILSTVGTSTLYTTWLELGIAKNRGDAQQAYYAAIAGIETARALIYKDAEDRKQAGKHYRTNLYDWPQQFRDIAVGRAKFSLIRGKRDGEIGNGPRGLVYGIADEEARLNLNSASLKQLQGLLGLGPDIAAAIADWRDADNKLTEEGAELAHYMELRDPYVMRNGAFETVRELLQVRGVSEEFFLREDSNFNGILDANENDGERSYPPDNADNYLERGWGHRLTVHSETPNQSARQRSRVNIQSTDAEGLGEIEGITPDLAAAIVAYRGKKSLDTIGHLLDVTYVQAETEPTNREESPSSDGASERAMTDLSIQNTMRESNSAPAIETTSNARGDSPATSGPPLITERMLQQMADEITASSNFSDVGLLNINTADAATLECLEGIDETLALDIVSHRQTRGDFGNVAELLQVPGLGKDIFKGICSRVTTYSSTFRILAEGRVPSTGASRRVEVVIRRTRFGMDLLEYRDDD